MADYHLKCTHPDCHRLYQKDPGMRLVCDEELAGRHGPALLQALYGKRRLDVNTDLPGIFAYSDWLPTGSYYLDPPDHGLGGPHVYKSSHLAKRFGLKNLYIAFSGYWPERGAHLITRTFKEFECQASLARYLVSDWQEDPMPLIVASAGNTANGYNLLTALLKLPVVLVIPESGLEKLLLPMKTQPFLILVRGDIRMRFKCRKPSRVRRAF